MQVATQWRIVSGMSIAKTGLDYGAILQYMEILELPMWERRLLMSGLREVERAEIYYQNELEASRNSK